MFASRVELLRTHKNLVTLSAAEYLHLPSTKTCHFDRSEVEKPAFPPPLKLVILSEAEGPVFRWQSHKCTWQTANKSLSA
jgi:hypothetical protein